jgi:hypothetical protein
MSIYRKMQTKELKDRAGLTVTVTPAVLKRLSKDRKAYPQNTVFLAYKFSTLEGKSSVKTYYKPKLVHRAGAELRVPTCDVSTIQGCGAGVNVGTLSWCMNNRAAANDANNLVLWLVAFKADDIACLPCECGRLCSKFRLFRCDIVMQMHGIEGFK